MSAHTPDGDVPVSRLDRIFSFTGLGLIAVGVVCFFVIMAGTAFHADQTALGWLILFWVTAVAPVIGFLLILVVVFMSFARRSRANKAR